MSHTQQPTDQADSDDALSTSTSHDEPALSVWTVQPGSHTFTSDKIKNWVERYLSGSVLNLCAGPTQLDHEGPVLRNDIDASLDTDLSIDAQLISSCLPSNSIDTVVFDPPFSVYQSNLRYDGQQVGHAKVAKEGFDELLRMGGTVIELGYHGSCMPARLGYDRVERAWFCTTGRHKDVLGSVDRKVQTELTGGGVDD